VNSIGTDIPNGTQQNQPLPESTVADQIQLAQQELTAAVMALGMAPAAAAVSGFLNSLLVSCRADAAAETAVQCLATTVAEREQFYTAAFLRFLRTRAAQLTAQAQSPKIIMSAPPGLVS